MKSSPSPDLPRAKIKKRRGLAFIWLIPLLAAVAAVWVVGTEFKQQGPLITIVFDNGDGLLANQTIVKYHGVRIGEVRSIRLTPDLQGVEVQVRLQRSAASLARAGSHFWIVRPELSSGGLRGLETIVSGPYIEAQPGGGDRQTKFAGLAEAPISAKLNAQYEVIVTTPQITTLSVGAPVYYRGIEVGQVANFALGADARMINIHLLIETNYVPLVRSNTKFWNAGGISFRLKMLGLNMSAENVKSLFIGGVAFATPNEPGSPSPSGSVFPLNERSESDWLTWSPAIAITTTNSHNRTGSNPSPATLLDDVDPNGK